MNMKNKGMLIGFLGVITVGIIGFLAGVNYQKSQTNLNFFSQSGQRQMSRKFGNGNSNVYTPVMGQIISQEAKNITIQMQDDSQKIVGISEKTIISKTSSASATDLIKGDRVAVFGSVNSDGSLNAQNIQVNPMFRMNGRLNNQNELSK